MMPPMINHLKTARLAIRLLVGAFTIFLCLSYGKTSNTALSAEPSGRQDLLNPYEQRMVSVDEQHSQRLAGTQQAVPPGFQPWWDQYLDRPLWGPDHPLTVDVETLVLGAMMHSPKVLALSTIPEIQKTEICVAQAAFDPRAFLESKFIRTSETATTILTAGGDTSLTPRYRDQYWYYSGGVRKKTDLGGQFEISQKFGLEDNNALIYQPDWALYPQGSARLTISYTQPLLNGAGRAYNESVIVLAAIDASVATDQFASDLQNHLLDVNKAYWTLYLERVSVLQKRQLLQQAESILNELDARRNFDANGGQIVRVRSAVESRRAGLIRYDAAVHNAEARLNLLVNDPHLYASDHVELIPVQFPHLQYPQIGVRDSLITALYNRPEVDQSLQQIKAASIREQVAQKDLLPVLDAILSVYAMGLEGDSHMGQAFVDQFSFGEPGYTTGLQFEVPLGNRAAKARLLKRQLECQQFSLQLRQAIASLVEEIEVAVRDVDASYHEAQSQYLAMQAAETEIRYLEARWRLLPSEDQVAGIVLEDLLSAQERYGNAELNFATAQVAYNIALANWNRATGVLLKCLPTAPPSQQAASQQVPPQKGMEEVPVPPSQPVPPAQAVPPSPPPALPSLGNASAGMATTNAAPAKSQTSSNNNARKGKEKTQLAGQGSPPRGETESAPLPPPCPASAPLPPALTNSTAPAVGATLAEDASAVERANSNQARRSVERPQPGGARTDQGSSPQGAEAAPLPPGINNVPATAAVPAKDIVQQ